MVDVRDVATAHVAAARIQGAVGHRFVLSSPTAVPRARLLQLLKGKYPTFELADAGTPADPATLRELFCSKTTVPLLGLTLRDPDQSLLAMAEAMIALGSATPSKHTSPAKRAPKLASARKAAMYNPTPTPAPKPKPNPNPNQEGCHAAVAAARAQVQADGTAL